MIVVLLLVVLVMAFIASALIDFAFNFRLTASRRTALVSAIILLVSASDLVSLFFSLIL